MTIEAYNRHGTSFMLTSEQFELLKSEVWLHIGAFKSDVTTDIAMLFKSSSSNTTLALPEKFSRQTLSKNIPRSVFQGML